ncbi:hypothetical protein cpu_10160 [Carboxydothermus pertinax]|uniref:Uncharacterized protein n=1 Tax=Carboxydothermus pertinax TaxID=870242 RepID=A0A1L8CUB6_9THEO|nr:hypothetical protein cpu_10160 [Carboxydothermus pertinax]
MLRKDLIATFLVTFAFLAGFMSEYLQIAPRVIGFVQGFLVLFCGDYLGKRQALLYFFLLGFLEMVFLNPLVGLKYLLLYTLLPLFLVLIGKKAIYALFSLVLGSIGISIYLFTYLKYFNFIYLFNFKINNYGYLVIIAVLATIVYYIILYYGWNYIKKSLPENFLKYLLNGNRP